MESYEIIKKAVDKRGVKKVANEMKVSASLLYKWCEESKEKNNDPKSGARNPLDRILSLYQATGEEDILHWLNAKADGFFTKNPPVKSANINAEYIAQTQQIIREFSELLQVMSEAIANDGQIDEKESKLLRKEWQDLKSHGETFITACEKGIFKDSK